MELKILDIPDECTGCGACVSVCPKNALTLVPDSEGFYFPKLNPELCINCKLCEKVCQVFTKSTDSTNFRKPYMMKASDKELVRASSSGGAFSMLADLIISEGGAVYGARYDFELEKLRHDNTDECPLEVLRKSKYIESYLGSTFREVGEKLKDGRKVMFVGTPCQIEGLNDYLAIKRISTENLVLVRFVCHGVPSNRFFTEYKRYEEKKHRSDLVAFDFRPKIRGWRSSDWRMKFGNGTVDEGPYYYYYYYYYYQTSNILRKSCYSCRRVLDNIPDFTIGDFWGIATYMPENKDNEGISLLIAHSEKAEKLLTKINNYKYIESLPESAISYITRETNDRPKHMSSRTSFMNEVIKNGYMSTAKRYARKDIMKYRFKGFLRRLLHKK